MQHLWASSQMLILQDLLVMLTPLDATLTKTRGEGRCLASSSSSHPSAWCCGLCFGSGAQAYGWKEKRSLINDCANKLPFHGWGGSGGRVLAARLCNSSVR